MFTHLGQSQLVASAKEGLCVRQQRFNLLLHRCDPFLACLLLLSIGLSAEQAEHVRADLRAPGIVKEIEPSTEERSLRGVGRWQQRRRLKVGQELNDDAGFGQGLLGTQRRRGDFQRRNQTALESYEAA